MVAADHENNNLVNWFTLIIIEVIFRRMVNDRDANRSRGKRGI